MISGLVHTCTSVLVTYNISMPKDCGSKIVQVSVRHNLFQIDNVTRSILEQLGMSRIDEVACCRYEEQMEVVQGIMKA